MGGWRRAGGDGSLADEVVGSGEGEEVDAGETKRCGRGDELPLVLDCWSSGCCPVSHYRDTCQ